MASIKESISNHSCNAKLKIISLNVRGLRNKKKRRTLFRKFKKENYDLICLQETYMSKKVRERRESGW